jgi:TPR repeat protein
VFQYLAGAGNADGALAMGATFDARFLAAHNAIGVAADDARARSWYRRAVDLGSAQAKTLLAQMADR